MQQQIPSDDEGGGDEQTEEFAAEPIALTQPVGSKVVMERFADGLTLQVPPAGLIAGSKGLFVFAVLWMGIVGFITVIFFVSIVAANGKQNGPIWVPFAILSLFDMVGALLLVASINMGKRKAALAVTGGTLMVIQSGPFGTKQRDWPAGQVSSICAGPSGMEVNDVPVLELQIFDASGQKFGLLAGRGDNELKWLASELRAALGLA